MSTTLALAIAGLDEAEAYSARAVGTYLATVGAYSEAREAEGSKAVSVRALAKAEGITDSEAAKALAVGEAVATLGMPDALPDDALPVLRKALGRVGTILGKESVSVWRDMISAAPEGADAWHVIDQAARQAGKRDKADRAPVSDGKRLKAALATLSAIDGARLLAEDDATLKAVADAVNAIVRARVAARDAAKADAA